MNKQEFSLDPEPGYHLWVIPRGKNGEASKIFEEACELMDAEAQDSAVMAIQELSDLVGAIRLYLAAHHPSLTLHDLEIMADITARAFNSGRRS